MLPQPSPPSEAALTPPLDTLHAELRTLHQRAGEPSMRTVAARTEGKISHDTVHRLLVRGSDSKVPRWPTLETLVTALGGDTARFHELWLASRAAEEAEAEDPGTPPDFAQDVRSPLRERATDPAWPPNSLLGRLREGPRRELLNLGTIVRYTGDREIITQGAKDTHLFLLLDGAVKVLTTDETGDTAVLSIRTAGDVIGEMAALDHKPRSATVVTCGDVIAKLITSSELHSFLHRRNDAFIELIGTLNDDLRWSYSRRRDFMSHTAAERIARVLVELLQTHGRRETAGWTLGIPLTKVELASMVGLKPRTAEKAFSDLRKAGVVVSHLRRDVLVPDLDALRKIAGP